MLNTATLFLATNQTRFKWNHSMELARCIDNIGKFITSWTCLQCITFLFSISCSSLLLEYFVLRAWQFNFIGVLVSQYWLFILFSYTFWFDTYILWTLGLTAFAIEKKFLDRINTKGSIWVTPHSRASFGSVITCFPEVYEWRLGWLQTCVSTVYIEF